MTVKSFVSAAVVAAALVLAGTAAIAQDDAKGSNLGQGMGMGPGMGQGMGMGSGSGWGMGPGMMVGRGMMGGMGIMGGCPMMGGGGKMTSHVEGRIAFLKAELGITDQQQAAWSAYADAVRKNLGSMQSMHKTMMTAMQADGAVERLDAHIAMMESRLASLKEVKGPLVSLYGVLGADQKQKADDLITGMGCMM